MHDPASIKSWTGMVAVEDIKADAAIRHELLDDYRADVASSWVRLSGLIEANLRAAGIEIPGR